MNTVIILTHLCCPLSRIKRTALSICSAERMLEHRRLLSTEISVNRTSQWNSVECLVDNSFIVNQHGMQNLTFGDGFSLLFKSNYKEMLNEPITFSHPLPYWLRGTLVSNNFLYS